MALDANSSCPAAAGARLRPPSWLRALRIVWRRHARPARHYIELSRLDERLLYDIGIDPLDVRDALNEHRAPGVLLQPIRKRAGR